jgi:thiazolinyl reductase component of yersiniabactin synthetase
MRVLLCGTVYGSAYLRALDTNETGLQLAGILARSERSRELARQWAVPFYATVDEVPVRAIDGAGDGAGDGAIDAAIDAAIVAISGEAGHAIASALLARGVPVLAEHPIGVAGLTAQRATSREHGTVFHVNAHYSDLDAPATFVAAFHGARQRSPLLFLHLLVNPRTLYSALEIAGRCLGPMQVGAFETLPPLPGSFFVVTQAIVSGAPVTIQLQRASSAVDDGSSNWVSHHLLAGFQEGVLSLQEAQGPVIWMPSPPSLGQLQAAPELWSRSLWRVLASPPPTFGEFVNGGRDRANRLALARFAREIASRNTEPEQSDEHLLGVSALWEAVLATSLASQQGVTLRR